MADKVHRLSLAASCNMPFVLVNEDDISQLIEDSDAENTKRQIKYAVSRIKSFALCASETCLENI